MRKQEVVLKEITAWAFSNESVRTVILTSSRATTNSRIDLFSDYDIEIGVNHLAAFLHHNEWLSMFGEVIAIIREDNETYSMRLVLYADYIRIDFKIYDVAYLHSISAQGQLPKHWDIGYRILIDKDNVTTHFPPPAYKAFLIRKPTEEEFATVVNDFWWDITYVAKSLWRDELFYAKYMMDALIRISYLQKMIEWYIGVQHQWNISTNKNGRFFKQYLDGPTWLQLEKTYAANSIEENWNALFAMVQLFRRLATFVAISLQYSYPQQTDIAISEYIEKIKKQDKNATDII